MHDTALWVHWYLLFLSVPALLVIILIRDWSGRHRTSRAFVNHRASRSPFLQ